MKHTSKKGIQKNADGSSQQVEQLDLSLMPSASEFKELHAISPELADRYYKEFEKEAEYRRAFNTDVTNHNKIRNRNGQWMGFGLLVSCIAGIVALSLFTNNPLLNIPLGTIALGLIYLTFRRT